MAKNRNTVASAHRIIPQSEPTAPPTPVDLLRAALRHVTELHTAALVIKTVCADGFDSNEIDFIDVAKLMADQQLIIVDKLLDSVDEARSALERGVAL